jgi:hypothetical protein
LSLQSLLVLPKTVLFKDLVQTSVWEVIPMNREEKEEGDKEGESQYHILPRPSHRQCGFNFIRSSENHAESFQYCPLEARGGGVPINIQPHYFEACSQES